VSRVPITPELARGLNEAHETHRGLVEGFMEERRRLLMRLEEAKDEEGRRIASDIHDDSIQVMTAADLQAQELAGLIQDPALRAQAERVRDTIRDAVQRLRHLMFELRPPSLDRNGLVSALRSYASALEGPEVAVEDALASEPAPDLGTVAFRIAREAITNARKHARASRVTVTVSSEGDGMRLRVTDDGEGFDMAIVDDPDPGHIGLAAMIERAELAGGWLRIDSVQGRGTSVDAWLPSGRDGLGARVLELGATPES